MDAHSLEDRAGRMARGERFACAMKASLGPTWSG